MSSTRITRIKSEIKIFRAIKVTNKDIEKNGSVLSADTVSKV